MNNSNERKQQWNQSYCRGGNICFYPNEEIIRFVNKYVRKREADNTFHNVMNLGRGAIWGNFKSLDLGCGIGRHVKFLDEFKLNPYGVDLSDTAISFGKKWFHELGRDDLAEKMIVGSVTDLPFENNSFEICVSHGVFDSMYRDIATKGIKEVLRVLKPNGLMYIDLIMDSQRGNCDEIVDSGYEKDTVQSYFTVDEIEKLLEEYGNIKIIEFKIITWSDRDGHELNKRASIIFQKECE